MSGRDTRPVPLRQHVPPHPGYSHILASSRAASRSPIHTPRSGTSSSAAATTAVVATEAGMPGFPGGLWKLQSSKVSRLRRTASPSMTGHRETGAIRPGHDASEMTIMPKPACSAERPTTQCPIISVAVSLAAGSFPMPGPCCGTRPVRSVGGRRRRTCRTRRPSRRAGTGVRSYRPHVMEW